MMQFVTSKDGTRIACEQTGQGASLILVTGATANSRDQVNLAGELAPNFTVYNYDRRGRGESGDTLPFAVEREIEDIETLINAAGGKAYVHGISSGGILALRAARVLGNKIIKLSVYEPPFIVDDTRTPIPLDYVDNIAKAVAANRPGDAMEIFLSQAIQLPAAYIEQMKQGPDWAGMAERARTTHYDGAAVLEFMQGKPWPPDTWSAIKIPVLVMVGGNTEPFFFGGTKLLADSLSNAEYHILPDQTHDVDAKLLAAELTAFFK